MIFAVLGPLAYILQLKARMLFVTYYLPVVGTVALCLCLLALIKARSVARFVTVGLCGLLAAFEGFLVLPVSGLPAYTGPVEVGKPFPDFAVSRADGSSFTRADLQGNQSTVMLFFRGHW